MPVSFYAWTTRLSDGSRFLVGALVGGHHTPLCALKESVVAQDHVRALAQAHADATRQPVFLERFDHAGTLQTLTPEVLDAAQQ